MASMEAYDQIVYLLQGGGALGAYQMGVCAHLLENDCAPHWVIGTSIGAANAAIIAGNPLSQCAEKLREFWESITSPLSSLFMETQNVYVRKWQNFLSAQWTLLFGQPGFFDLQCDYLWADKKTTPDKIGFYDTSILRQTLEKVIDFDLINQKKIRLTLNSLCIEDNEVVCFDNTKQEIGPEHIMASGALPLGFPAILIEGKYYWDAGISSNTPLSVIAHEQTNQKLLCFLIDLFGPAPVPTSLLDTFKAKKNIEYASRYRRVVENFCEIHALQHAIHHLCDTFKIDRESPEFKKIIELGRPSILNIIRFQYQDCPYDLWSKDFEFSRQSIQERYQMGYDAAQNALTHSSWLDLPPLNSGAIIHDFY